MTWESPSIKKVVVTCDDEAENTNQESLCSQSTTAPSLRDSLWGRTPKFFSASTPFFATVISTSTTVKPPRQFSQFFLSLNYPSNLAPNSRLPTSILIMKIFLPMTMLPECEDSALESPQKKKKLTITFEDSESDDEDEDVRRALQLLNFVRRSRRTRRAWFSAWSNLQDHMQVQRSTGCQGALCLAIKCRSATCDEEEGHHENVVDLLETAKLLSFSLLDMLAEASFYPRRRRYCRAPSSRASMLWGRAQELPCRQGRRRIISSNHKAQSKQGKKSCWVVVRKAVDKEEEELLLVVVGENSLCF